VYGGWKRKLAADSLVAKRMREIDATFIHYQDNRVHGVPDSIWNVEKEEQWRMY
jgi:hypothetical protein